MINTKLFLEKKQNVGEIVIFTWFTIKKMKHTVLINNNICLNIKKFQLNHVVFQQ